MSENGGAKWIDITNPSKEDLQTLKDRFGFHEVILEELKVPSVRSHIELYDSYIYFVYNFPIYNHGEQTSRRGEVDFLISGDTVITAHYENLEPLQELEIRDADHPFEILYRILMNIMRFEERQLRHIREKVEQVGDELFRGREKDNLHKISLLKRDVSEYRIIVRSGENIINSLKDHGPRLWGEETRVYLNELIGQNLKIISQADDYRNVIDDFDSTNSQLMNAKTTQVMKTLTGFSFLTFPFMLFVSLFAMRLPGNPLEGVPYGFWMVTGIIAVGILSLFIYFRRRGWL